MLFLMLGHLCEALYELQMLLVIYKQVVQVFACKSCRWWVLTPCSCFMQRQQQQLQPGSVQPMSASPQHCTCTSMLPCLKAVWHMSAPHLLMCFVCYLFVCVSRSAQAPLYSTLLQQNIAFLDYASTDTIHTQDLCSSMKCTSLLM